MRNMYRLINAHAHTHRTMSCRSKVGLLLIYLLITSSLRFSISMATKSKCRVSFSEFISKEVAEDPPALAESGDDTGRGLSQNHE